MRVGGEYRIAMQPPDGQLFHLRGAFLEVDRPRRLSYTFEWEEPDPDDQETVVKLTFREFGDGTEFVLEQGPFATDARPRAPPRGVDGRIREGSSGISTGTSDRSPEATEDVSERAIRRHVLGTQAREWRLG